VPETEQLRRLFQLASDQLRSALQSLCDGDLTAALSIQGRDAELDATYREYNKIVMAKMQADPGQIPDYVDMLFCSRFLERVGDQSVNIAEDAIYLLTAQDVRHGGTLNNPS
jgi:phosphate transport system protein